MYQLAEVLGVLYAKLVGGVFYRRVVVFVYSSEDEEAERKILHIAADLFAMSAYFLDTLSELFWCIHVG